VQAGITRGEMAVRLDVTPREVRRAIDDLQQIAGEIELGDRPGDD
jgi:predicted ArsR family transcriptional regulator